MLQVKRDLGTVGGEAGGVRSFGFGVTTQARRDHIVLKEFGIAKMGHTTGHVGLLGGLIIC